MMNNTMLDIARRRYTTKHYDAARRLGEAEWSALFEILRLSPSSVNAQPWHWFLIESEEARKKLLPAIYDFNQERVINASGIVLFTVPETIDDVYLEELLAQEVADGRVTPDAARSGVDVNRRRFVKLHQMTHREQIEWETRQAYISLGIFCYAAAGMGIDTTCIEGMDMLKADEAFGLREKGFRTVVSCAVGYRSSDDSNACRPKSRWPLEKVLTRL